MQSEILLEKLKLRKAFIEQRSRLSKEEVEIKSQKINFNFIKNLLPKIPDYQNKIFSLYFSCNNEVDVKAITKHFQQHNIKFSYPKITAKNQPLEFILAEKNQKIVYNNSYKSVLEVASGQVILPNILILPLVAFDSNMTRLGMGGGFFDRTISHLKSQNHKITIIGLAYDFQGSKGPIPAEITDQRLDFIVSESEVFSREPALSISDT